MKKFGIVLAVLFAAVAGGVALFRYTAPVANGPERVPSPSPEDVADGRAVVRYTDEGGFAPSPIRIRVGETVTFVNAGTRPIWPASAMHPTHRVYPGSDIEKCGTPAQSQIFDACHGIPPGSNWSFTFSVPGTWRYHDHLQSARVGVVEVVEEE